MEYDNKERDVLFAEDSGDVEVGEFNDKLTVFGAAKYMDSWVAVLGHTKKDKNLMVVASVKGNGDTYEQIKQNYGKTISEASGVLQAPFEVPIGELKEQIILKDPDSDVDAT